MIYSVCVFWEFSVFNKEQHFIQLNLKKIIMPSNDILTWPVRSRHKRIEYIKSKMTPGIFFLCQVYKSSLLNVILRCLLCGNKTGAKLGFASWRQKCSLNKSNGRYERRPSLILIGSDSRRKLFLFKNK